MPGEPIRVLAIDPGPKESAWVIFDGASVLDFGMAENPAMVDLLAPNDGKAPTHFLAIEKIASYGMPVGEEIFETVYWTGRFVQRFDRPAATDRITRIAVKSHLCHSAKAKDGNIRQALIDRLGTIGTKKNKGPLYGVSGDVWSALAVAVTWWDTRRAI